MFAEDLEAFFSDFGIEVAITRAGTPIATATLIYEAPLAEVNVYDRSFYDEKFYEARSQGAAVRLLGVEADVASVQIGDVATVNSFNWYIVTIEPDGTGLVTLRLSANSI